MIWLFKSEELKVDEYFIFDVNDINSERRDKKLNELLD